MKTWFLVSATAVVVATGTVDAALIGSIPLSNLFDDPKGTPLAVAINSDAFQAAASAATLGVELVRVGQLGGFGSIAPGISFDTSSAGGANLTSGILPSNDSVNSLSTIGLSLTGSFLSPQTFARVEDGIGLWADQLISFDLDEIRSAGAMAIDTPFTFTSNAGINDYAGSSATLNLIALVSDAAGVTTGWINGVQTPVIQTPQGFTFSVGAQQGLAGPTTLNDANRLANFNVPIPAGSKYLTLASLSLGDNSFADQGVFGNAILTPNVPPVPAPGTLLVVGGAMIVTRRRRR